MIKVFGSENCPDCVNFKFNLDKYELPYEFVDINESMRNLKLFLKKRDHEEIFKSVIEEGRVGVPAIEFEDGTTSLEWEKYITDAGFEVAQREIAAGSACRLDGTGC